MSDTQSLDFGIDQSLHLNPISHASKTKVNNKLFQTENRNVSNSANKCLNVLFTNKLNSKFIVNQAYQQFLTEDIENPDVVVVSVLGTKKIGKSFLVDSLLTHDNNKICRIMSKNPDTIVNSPTATLAGTSNRSKIVMFDCSGDASCQIFLWNYFISSIMVYNLGNNNPNQDQLLISFLTYVQSHLDSQADDFSLPQLVLLIRDSSDHHSKRELINQIEGYGLFQPAITVMHIPYPGSDNVAAKQIVDVPLRQLNPKFTTEVEKLTKIIKNGKTKIIKGNYVSIKMLSLILDPLTRCLNKQNRLNANKIWEEVVENLSIGFYNYYLKKYEQQLNKQFSNEQPLDKYTLYKKLSNLKRKINEKVEGFRNLEQDPTFSRYKQKLNKTIKQKQKLIKQVNQVKSKEANDEYSQRLLKQINNNNYSQVISEYCKSGLDDQKCDVLLENFGRALEQRSKSVKKNSGKSDSICQQIQNLQNQVASLQHKIKDRSKLSKDWSEGEAVKKSTAAKDAKIKQLQANYNQLKQKANSLASERKKNQEVVKLQEQCQNLRQKIGRDERQTIELRQNRQKQMKQVSKQLQSRLKKEEQKLRLLEQKLKQLKSKPKKIEQKKNTCCCVIM